MNFEIDEDALSEDAAKDLEARFLAIVERGSIMDTLPSPIWGKKPMTLAAVMLEMQADESDSDYRATLDVMIAAVRSADIFVRLPAQAWWAKRMKTYVADQCDAYCPQMLAKLEEQAAEAILCAQLSARDLV